MAKVKTGYLAVTGYGAELSVISVGFGPNMAAVTGERVKYGDAVYREVQVFAPDGVDPVFYARGERIPVAFDGVCGFYGPFASITDAYFWLKARGHNPPDDKSGVMEFGDAAANWLAEQITN